jgi:hypothetical protein
MLIFQVSGALFPPEQPGHMKIRLVVWFGLLAAGFLAGFLPESSRASRLSSELASARQQLTSCQLSSGLSDARNLLGMTYLEANNKNYGLAGEYSTRFFDQMRQLADRTRDEGLKRVILEVLNTRDTVTAELARGDPAVLDRLGSLLTKTGKAGKG